jgi:AAA ATPase domain
VLVTVLGDAGVGKTRLMRELWERLAADDAEPLRRTGRCLPYGDGITFWPLGEALKEHLGILESDPPEEVRRRLGDREILGLTFGLDVAGDLHPLAARDRLHAAWVDFLTEEASDRPVVLLVEDVHWGDRRCWSCSNGWRATSPHRCCCSRPRGPTSRIVGCAHRRGDDPARAAVRGHDVVARRRARRPASARSARSNRAARGGQSVLRRGAGPADA